MSAERGPALDPAPLAPERPRARIEGLPLFGTAFLGLGYVAVPALLLALGLSALRFQAYLGREASLAFLGLGLAATFLGTHLALRAATRRRGEVDFFADRLRISKHWTRVEVLAYAELAGFSLPAAGFVQLHRRGEERPRLADTIPTPSPQRREQALDLLREAGLAEQEAA